MDATIKKKSLCPVCRCYVALFMCPNCVISKGDWSNRSHTRSSLIMKLNSLDVKIEKSLEGIGGKGVGLPTAIARVEGRIEDCRLLVQLRHNQIAQKRRRLAQVKADRARVERSVQRLNKSIEMAVVKETKVNSLDLSRRKWKTIDQRLRDYRQYLVWRVIRDIYPLRLCPVDQRLEKELAEASNTSFVDGFWRTKQGGGAGSGGGGEDVVVGIENRALVEIDKSSLTPVYSYLFSSGSDPFPAYHIKCCLWSIGVIRHIVNVLSRILDVNLPFRDVLQLSRNLSLTHLPKNLLKTIVLKTQIDTAVLTLSQGQGDVQLWRSLESVYWIGCHVKKLDERGRTYTMGEELLQEVDEDCSQFQWTDFPPDGDEDGPSTSLNIASAGALDESEWEHVNQRIPEYFPSDNQQILSKFLNTATSSVSSLFHLK